MAKTETRNDRRNWGIRDDHDMNTNNSMEVIYMFYIIVPKKVEQTK